jgi:hypothetical protein
MPFQQVDDNTVMDDQGNTYFMPFPGSPSGLGLPSEPAQTTDPGPSPQTLPDGTPIPPVTPYTPPAMAAQPENFYQPDKDFALTLQTQPGPGSKPNKNQVQQSNNSLMTNDVTAFSQAGGAAKTDEDFARMVGGHAAHEAQTAQAVSTSRAITAQGQIEKMKTQAAMVLQTADEYDKKVNSLMTDANNRWEDWKKRNDQAASQLISPDHAFNSGSRLSKVNWGLYMLGAGLQGGQSVDNAMNLINKMVEEDIAIQKFNTENKRKGLDEERLAIQEQDKIGKDQLSEWYFAKNLRLQAVGQSLDAKIAEMGRPAAQAAGLLQARDAIEKEVLKGQEHVGDHFFEKAKQQSSQAHDIYMERLKASLKKDEEAFKHRLSQDKNDTLPTNTQLGLQMVDKATGQVVPGGKIPLKVKGEKAVEAGQITSQANEEASQLRDVQAELKGLSTADLLRGGTPKFKAMVKDLIQTRAVRDNGHRLSDADVDRAAQEEFGVVMKDSIARNTTDAMRMVGPYKAGLEKTIDMQLRNLSTKTMNRLQPYIDSDTAQAYDIQYNVQGTHVPEQNPEADDLNTAITKAAGPGDASDLLAPGPRPPLEKDELPKPGDVQKYKEEKAKGRGFEGGLPIIPEQQEDKVNQAAATFSHATVEDIIKLSGAYLRNPKLSPETKHEIRMESLEALQTAKERESAVLEEAIKEYGKTHHSAEAVDNNGVVVGADPEDAYKPNSNEFTDEFEKFFNSGLVDEMRKRAGLEPRKK